VVEIKVCTDAHRELGREFRRIVIADPEKNAVFANRKYR
jgi:hypothetical protein